MAQNNPLLISLLHPEALDPAVRTELEQIIATLQAWASVSGDSSVPGDLTVNGSATFLGQHCFRASASASVPTVVETAMVLAKAPANPDDAELYQTGIVLSDGDTSAYIVDPGLYIIEALAVWDLNAAGTYRMTQIRVASTIQTGYDRRAPSAAFAVTSHSYYATRVTKAFLATIPGGRVAVSCDCLQDSGITLAAAGWLTVTKVG